MISRTTSPRGVAAAALCGACAAPLWIGLVLWSSAYVWMPLIPWLMRVPRITDPLLLEALARLFDALLSALLALALTTPVGFFTRQRVLPLWTCFVAGVAAYFAADSVKGTLGTAEYLLRQPMSYALLLAAALGFHLGARLRGRPGAEAG